MASAVIRSLEAFLSGGTDATLFTVDKSTIDGMTTDDINEFNALMVAVNNGTTSVPVQAERVDNGYRLTKIDKASDTTGRAGSLYEKGAEDARVGQEGSQRSNPFRPRYRKLSVVELAHHDAIKNKAFELLQLFDQTLAVRTEASQSNSGEEYACLKLAERHLEDAVYRAVKALTA